MYVAPHGDLLIFIGGHADSETPVLVIVSASVQVSYSFSSSRKSQVLQMIYVKAIKVDT